MSSGPTFYDISSVSRPADRVGWNAGEAGRIAREREQAFFNRIMPQLGRSFPGYVLDTSTIMRKLTVVPPSRGLVAYETHGPCIGHTSALRIDFR
jgi:hypothetical protein